jgi:hypothetical protein
MDESNNMNPSASDVGKLYVSYAQDVSNLDASVFGEPETSEVPNHDSVFDMVEDCWPMTFKKIPKCNPHLVCSLRPLLNRTPLSLLLGP